MRVLDDMQWGAKRGISLAIIFCLWATIVFAFNGSTAFDRQQTTYAVVVITYLAIGLVSGSLVGALKRFASSERGAYVVGIAGGIPIAVGIEIALYGTISHWPPSARLFLPLYGIGAGCFIGNELNKARSERSNP